MTASAAAPAWAFIPSDEPPIVSGGRQFIAHPMALPQPVPVGPRSRLLVVGNPLFAALGAVFGHLTIAWRDAGQPLEVVHQAGAHRLGDAVRLWLAEHPCGHTAVEVDPHPWRGAVTVRPKAWRVLAFGDGWAVQVAQQAGLDIRQVAE